MEIVSEVCFTLVGRFRKGNKNHQKIQKEELDKAEKLRRIGNQEKTGRYNNNY